MSSSFHQYSKLAVIIICRYGVNKFYALILTSLIRQINFYNSHLVPLGVFTREIVDD